MQYKDIVAAVNAIISQYESKLTLRQIFYRLVTKELLPNTISSYKGLSSQLVKAREKGDVDADRIEDRSRWVQGHGDYGYNPETAFEDARIAFFTLQAADLRDSSKRFSRKLWRNQTRHVIIALEKDALSRVFVEIAAGYRVQVYATRGYSSYSFLKTMAENLHWRKQNIILYFGDYDPSGRDIERDLNERVSKYNYKRADFQVKRIALTKQQIHDYKLPHKPEDSETLEKLARDTRRKRYGIDYAVELDAIEPNSLQKLIEQAINNQIDAELWNRDFKQMKAEQKTLEEELSKTKIITPNGDEF